jgi:transcriptional regulator with GAF, ATPase, and Fis domain
VKNKDKQKSSSARRQRKTGIDIDIFVNCNWVDTRWQYTFTRNTYNITINNKTSRITNKTTQITNLEACWPCPIFVNCTLAFALQLREKHGKTSVRVTEEIQSIHTQDTHTLQNPHLHTHTHTHTHTLRNNLKPPQYKLKQTQYKIYPNEIIAI